MSRTSRLYDEDPDVIAYARQEAGCAVPTSPHQRPPGRLHPAKQQPKRPTTEPLRIRSVSRRRFLPAALWGMGAACAGLLYAPTIEQNIADQWTTGTDRIREFMLDVGHGGVSRFLTLYRAGAFLVIEFTHNADPAKGITYTKLVSQGDTAERIVTLTPEPHTRNLIVQVEGIRVLYRLVNKGGAFYVE